MPHMDYYDYPGEMLDELWERISESYKFKAVGLECGRSNKKLLEHKLEKKVMLKERLLITSDIDWVVNYLSDPLVNVVESYPCCVKEREESALTINHKYNGRTHLLIVPGVVGEKPAEYKNCG